MKRKYVILLHLLAWTIFILNDVLPRFSGNVYDSYQAIPKDAGLLGKYILISLGFTTISALCFYGSYLIVAPALFMRKRYVQALLLTLALVAALVGWRYVVEFGFFKPVLSFDNYKGRPVRAGFYISNVFWFYFPTYFLYGLMFFFAENWWRDRKRQEVMLREKLTAELAFLRSQINPHFLFNTINDIYALTYQKSEQAPQALLKLSELLRYMLREGSSDLVPLQNELDHLQNLVELQRIGAKGNAFIELEFEGDTGSRQVASLLFVAFVENAFKHGVLNDPVTPVRIRLIASTGLIDLTVSNKIRSGQKDPTGGIGLTNVRRRLELLYPDEHSLEVTSAEYYTVHLQLRTKT